MHADICDPNDEAAVARFRAALKSLGATFNKKDWAIGVDTYDLQIGDQSITVFSDTWSIDIKGPDDLVQRVIDAFKRSQPLTSNK